MVVAAAIAQAAEAAISDLSLKNCYKCIVFGPGKCLAGSGEVVFLRAFLMRQGKGCVRAELKSVRDATCSARLTFFFFF